MNDRGGAAARSPRPRGRPSATEAERARLEVALDAGGLAIWNWDFQTGMFNWFEPPARDLQRVPRCFGGSLDGFLELVHADDRAQVGRAFRRAADPAGSLPLRIEYRVVGPDHETRWIETRGQQLVDEHDRPVSMTGISADVTVRKEHELTVETQHARLDLALEIGRMGVWEWNLDTDEIKVSVPLQTDLGLPGRGPASAYFDLIHPDDRDRLARAIGSTVEHHEPVMFECRVLVDGGPGVRWIEGRGAAIGNTGDRGVRVTGVAVDVSERREAEERLRRKGRLLETLNEFGRAVTSRLDLVEVAQMVTDAGVALTAARLGALYIRAQRDGEAPYEILAASGGHRELLEALFSEPVAEVLAPVVRGEGAVRVDRLRPLVVGDASIECCLAVPIIAGGGDVIGALVFADLEPREFDDDDQAVAEGIAAQAAVAVTNAWAFEIAQREAEARKRALEERDAVVRTLQQSLLPPHLPRGHGFAFGSAYRAGRESVGGDFYDVFRLSTRQWGAVIGDVCGKGAEAAALTALTRYTVRSAAVVESQAREVLTFLNDAVRRDRSSDRFCTAAYVRLQRVRRGLAAQVGIAGHPPPIVVRASGHTEILDPTGMLLGVVEEPEIAQHATVLRPGDALVMYTDGVPDARRSGEAFGYDRLVTLLGQHAGRPAQSIADAVSEAVANHEDGAGRDDVAVLVVTIDAERRN